jgi:hypothetical protein
LEVPIFTFFAGIFSLWKQLAQDVDDNDGEEEEASMRKQKKIKR